MKSRVLTSYCLPVQNEETADSFGFTLLSLLTHARVAPDSILAAAISSVVPRMDSLVREAVPATWTARLFFAPHDLPIPLENRYDRPEEVGADRLVGAFAARRLFPAPQSLIVVGLRHGRNI